VARVGVIGLGNIGGAVAANLVADGDDVVVADIDPARAAAIAGARPGDVAAVARASEITITSLPTPEVVAEVASAWAAAAPTDAILLDLSTSSPAGNRALAAKLADTGHHFVEAPLTGGAVGAQKRSLVFMVGGDDEPVARCLPLLDRLGRATFHLGPVGAGTIAACPSPGSFATSASSRSRRRPVTTTVAPRPASTGAAAAPMPEEAPVSRTVAPARGSPTP
jgi:3-hydroxyisobutyrate dehydrogenase